jgi:hypothetical protein
MSEGSDTLCCFCLKSVLLVAVLPAALKLMNTHMGT